MENTEKVDIQSPPIFKVNQITLPKCTEAVHKHQVGGADHWKIKQNHK